MYPLFLQKNDDASVGVVIISAFTARELAQSESDTRVLQEYYYSPPPPSAPPQNTTGVFCCQPTYICRIWGNPGGGVILQQIIFLKKQSASALANPFRAAATWTMCSDSSGLAASRSTPHTAPRRRSSGRTIEETPTREWAARSAPKTGQKEADDEEENQQAHQRQNAEDNSATDQCIHHDLRRTNFSIRYSG